MNRRACQTPTKVCHSEAGFTLIELMFASGVMVIGMVMLMGSVVNLSAQTKVAETAVAASHFNTSVLESMRGRGLEDILSYNSAEEEFEVNEGKIYLEGLGYAMMDIWCIVSDPSAGTTRVNLPMSDSEMQSFAATAPNPIEIQIRLSLDRGFGEGEEFKFMTSGLIYY